MVFGESLSCLTSMTGFWNIFGESEQDSTLVADSGFSTSSSASFSSLSFSVSFYGCGVNVNLITGFSGATFDSSSFLLSAGDGVILNKLIDLEDGLNSGKLMKLNFGACSLAFEFPFMSKRLNLSGGSSSAWASLIFFRAFDELSGFSSTSFFSGNSCLFGLIMNGDELLVSLCFSNKLVEMTLFYSRARLFLISTFDESWKDAAAADGLKLNLITGFSFESFPFDSSASPASFGGAKLNLGKGTLWTLSLNDPAAGFEFSAVDSSPGNFSAFLPI